MWMLRNPPCADLLEPVRVSTGTAGCSTRQRNTQETSASLASFDVMATRWIERQLTVMEQCVSVTRLLVRFDLRLVSVSVEGRWGVE